MTETKFLNKKHSVN